MLFSLMIYYFVYFTWNENLEVPLKTAFWSFFPEIPASAFADLLTPTLTTPDSSPG